MSYYADVPHYQYATAPAPPPPVDSTYVVPPPPRSAFSPSHDYYEPSSPLVVAASPAPSDMHSRSNSHARGEYVAGERVYLAPGGYGGLGRSGSERGRRSGGQVVVESRRALSRPRDKQYRTKYYIDGDNYSQYSGSSYGGAGDSRDHSRDHSRHRRHHSRTSSCASNESYDDRYAVGLYRPSRQEEALTDKLKEVQKQLEKVQVDAEKKRMQDEQVRLEKLREQEIERKVHEQIKIQRRKEEDKERKEKEKMEAEKRRIADAAKQLLDQQAAAAAAKDKEAADLKMKIDAALQEERSKYNAAQSGKKTYTRFSKVHLCKEALEERGIPFTEEVGFPFTSIQSAISNADNTPRQVRLLPRAPLHREDRATVPLVPHKGNSM